MRIDIPELPHEVEVNFVCDLCWERFPSAVALMEHEAQEDDRLYDIDQSECAVLSTAGAAQSYTAKSRAASTLTDDELRPEISTNAETR